VKASGRRRIGWAVWCGLLALALNALVPVHLAFDLAEALGTAARRGAPAAAHSLEWRLWALIADHREADGKTRDHGKDHRTTCPVCSALGTFAGCALAAVAALPFPAPIVASAAPMPAEFAAATAPLAYRPRAPPVV
jgi:hypothetical protein